MEAALKLPALRPFRTNCICPCAKSWGTELAGATCTETFRFSFLNSPCTRATCGSPNTSIFAVTPSVTLVGVARGLGGGVLAPVWAYGPVKVVTTGPLVVPPLDPLLELLPHAASVRAPAKARLSGTRRRRTRGLMGSLL